VRGFVDDPLFAPILDRDLLDGQHRNPTSNPEYFTTAFFHRPEELRAEVAETGFSVVDLLPVEGPGGLAEDFEERWSDPVRRAYLLALIRRVEHEPLILGVSPHLLVIARK
jgi:hypothetical protein